MFYPQKFPTSSPVPFWKTDNLHFCLKEIFLHPEKASLCRVLRNGINRQSIVSQRTVLRSLHQNGLICFLKVCFPMPHPQTLSIIFIEPKNLNFLKHFGNLLSVRKLEITDLSHQGVWAPKTQVLDLLPACNIYWVLLSTKHWIKLFKKFFFFFKWKGHLCPGSFHTNQEDKT